MSHLKNFEAYTIVNKSDLDIAGTWSADYHWHLKAGRLPHTKKGFLLTEVPVKKKSSIPSKGVVFITPEDAEKLNEIGKAVMKKMELYNELFDALVYEKHEKGYEDEELKSRGRKSGVTRKPDGDELRVSASD